MYGITKEEWIQARDCNSTILATEIPLIPFHEGAKLPSGSFQHLIIKDKSNNQWGGELFKKKKVFRTELKQNGGSPLIEEIPLR